MHRSGPGRATTCRRRRAPRRRHRWTTIDGASCRLALMRYRSVAASASAGTTRSRTSRRGPYRSAVTASRASIRSVTASDNHWKVPASSTTGIGSIRHGRLSSVAARPSARTGRSWTRWPAPSAASNRSARAWRAASASASSNRRRMAVGACSGSSLGPVAIGITATASHSDQWDANRRLPGTGTTRPRSAPQSDSPT